jgi:hypothetical protein
MSDKMSMRLSFDSGQLSAVTNINVDRGNGTATTQYCKVTVLASPAGIITQLDTEDTNVGVLGVYGSLCGQRLGIKPQG